MMTKKAFEAAARHHSFAAAANELGVTLREIEGLSYEEIATAMDCPVGTVRSRIFRAREAIAKASAKTNGGRDIDAAFAHHGERHAEHETNGGHAAAAERAAAE